LVNYLYSVITLYYEIQRNQEIIKLDDIRYWHSCVKENKKWVIKIRGGMGNKDERVECKEFYVSK